ncbi:MAG: hypothetical protein AAF266_07095 [Planctomycetota bacterium]
MDRLASRTYLATCTLMALAAVASTGCHPGLLIATGVYLWEGGNFAPAECEALNDQKVVVFCRQPAAQEFRHAGASRQIAEKVSNLLEINLTGAEIVPQRKVDEWIDTNDSDDFEELGKAVKADLVVYIDMAHFDLFAGATVYQGNSDVTVSVYDMNDRGRLVWDKEMGEILYPVHAPIARQGKSVKTFQREYVNVMADKIARNFYPHDPNADFAIDALANR